MTGVAIEENLPLRWGNEENVRWHADLPGPGNSSPVVWGDRVFISQAVSNPPRRTLLCFDRVHGRLLWHAGVTYAEPEPTQESNPYCSGSPATDGKRVYGCFGSAGVYAYDFRGQERWHRDLGKLVHPFGNAVSPILYRGLCILNFSPGKEARLVALYKRTGRIAWEARPPAVALADEDKQGTDPPVGAELNADGSSGAATDTRGSWTTPLIIRTRTRDELIVSFSHQLAAYNPSTGRLLWFCRGLDGNTFSSPLWGDGVIVAVSSGLSGGAAIGVRPGGSGDVTRSHLVWRLNRVIGRLGSGIIHAGHIYGITEGGAAECLELRTGKRVWLEQLRGPSDHNHSWSSLLLAGDRIYIPNQAGDVFVLRASPRFELLATNSVAESSNASLAASDGALYLRTAKSLWCFSHAAK
jgi:outer membrane protein assembly factor BamB